MFLLPPPPTLELILVYSKELLYYYLLSPATSDTREFTEQTVPPTRRPIAPCSDLSCVQIPAQPLTSYYHPWFGERRSWTKELCFLIRSSQRSTKTLKICDPLVLVPIVKPVPVVLGPFDRHLVSLAAKTNDYLCLSLSHRHLVGTMRRPLQHST